MKVPMSLSVEDRVLKDIDQVAEKEFGGNRSAIFLEMYSTWRDVRRAKKRQAFLAFDAMVAKAIADTQNDGSSQPPTLADLQAYGKQKLAGQHTSLSSYEEIEDESVEAINAIRNERKDAYASRS